MDSHIQTWFGTLEPDALLDRTPHVLGTAFREARPELFQQAWDQVMSFEPVAYMIGLAAKYWEGSGHPKRLDQVQEVFIYQLVLEVGERISKSDWFEKNKTAINAEKKRLKTIRQVHNS